MTIADQHVEAVARRFAQAAQEVGLEAVGVVGDGEIGAAIPMGPSGMPPMARSKKSFSSLRDSL